VDHLNASDISRVLHQVATHYEDELRREGNRAFLRYIASMWEQPFPVALLSMPLTRHAFHEEVHLLLKGMDRLRNTAELFFGSSHLHFVLVAKDLEEEYRVCFQLLGLLFSFPLSTADLFVSDVLWFIRHHYAFFRTLHRAGYLREDPLHPGDGHGSSLPLPSSSILSPSPLDTVHGRYALFL
jgi:hypothetical protein